ncbi:MAG: hypothetical protein V4564_19835 [Pseudomonadota bacterium]
MVDANPQDGASPKRAVATRTTRIIMAFFACAAALIFYHILRETGPDAPLALLNRGDWAAGALKLGSYALIATGIQMLIFTRSPQLGFHGLLAVTAVLAGVLILWKLFLRLADGLPFLAPPLAFLVAAGLLVWAWKRRAYTAPLTPVGAGVAIVLALPVILLVIWMVMLQTLL